MTANDARLELHLQSVRGFASIKTSTKRNARTAPKKERIGINAGKAVTEINTVHTGQKKRAARPSEQHELQAQTGLGYLCACLCLSGQCMQQTQKRQRHLCILVPCRIHLQILSSAASLVLPVSRKVYLLAPCAFFIPCFLCFISHSKLHLRLRSSRSM